MPGQTLTVLAAHNGPVFLAYQDPRSQTPSWLGNNVASGLTPLAPDYGRAEFIYDNQPEGTFWRMVTHVQGQAMPMPFDPANFITNGGAWSISAQAIEDLAYTIVGKTIAFSLSIRDTGFSTLVAPAPTVLSIALPNGYTLARTQRSPSVLYVDNGGEGTAIAATIPSSQSLLLVRDFAQSQPWVVGNMGLICTVFAEIL